MVSAQRSSSFNSGDSWFKADASSGLRRTLSSGRSNELWEYTHDFEKGIVEPQPPTPVSSFSGRALLQSVFAGDERASSRSNSFRASHGGSHSRPRNSMGVFRTAGKGVFNTARLMSACCVALLVIVGCLGVRDSLLSSESSPILERSNSASSFNIGIAGESRGGRRLMQVEPRSTSAMAGKKSGEKFLGGRKGIVDSRLNPEKPLEKEMNAENVDLNLSTSPEVRSPAESGFKARVDPAKAVFLNGREVLIYSPALPELCLPTVEQWQDAFLCAVGEAIELKRTWIMESYFCVEANSTAGQTHRSLHEFRLYYDIDALKQALGGKIMEAEEFWNELELHNLEHRENAEPIMDVHEFENSRGIQHQQHPIVRRNILQGEPKTWSAVCSHDKSLKLAQKALQLHPALKRMADIIAKEMGDDFDSVEVLRGRIGDEQWPRLDEDTQPEAVLAVMKKSIKTGRRVFLTTDVTATRFFGPLRPHYDVRTLNDFQHLWSPTSDWAAAMKDEVGHGRRVVFDSYMRYLVGEEVIRRSKKSIETFRHLSQDARPDALIEQLPGGRGDGQEAAQAKGGKSSRLRWRLRLGDW